MQWLSDQRGPGQDLASSKLAEILIANDRIDEAIAVLRPFTTPLGDGPSASLLIDLLARHNRIDDLRTEVNAGVHLAMEKLIAQLRQHGKLSNSKIANLRTDGVTCAWPFDGSPP